MIRIINTILLSILIFLSVYGATNYQFTPIEKLFQIMGGAKK